MVQSRLELETSCEHTKCETDVITNYTIEPLPDVTLLNNILLDMFVYLVCT